MEWLGLCIWAAVLFVVVALAKNGALVAPALLLVPPIAVSGLAACVLYVAAPARAWLAWTSSAIALVAAAVVAAGAVRLIADDPRVAVSSAAEERAATLAGIALPLLLTNGAVLALAAVGVTTVT